MSAVVDLGVLLGRVVLDTSALNAASRSFDTFAQSASSKLSAVGKGTEDLNKGLLAVSGGTVMTASKFDELEAAGGRVGKAGEELGKGAKGLETVGAATAGARKEMGFMEGAMHGLRASTGGYISMLTGLPPQAAIGAAAVLGIVVASKSLLDTWRHDEVAQRALENAYKDTGVSLSKHQAAIENFIKTNRAYISDTAEAKEGFATLTRTGLDQTQVMKAMNVALDLAATKHMSLHDAVNEVALAEQGRGRALLLLGLNMKDYPVLAEGSTKAAEKEKKAKEAVAKAEEHLQEVLMKTGLSQGQASAATSEAVRAHNQAITAQLGNAHAAQALEHAQNAVAKAQLAYDRATTKWGGNSIQARKASMALASAHEHLQNVQDNQALSAEKAAISAGHHGSSLLKAYAASEAVRKAQEELAAAQVKSNSAHQDAASRIKEQNDLLDKMHGKTKDGRKSTDDMTQAQNQLKAIWAEIADRVGPGLEKIMLGVFKVLNGVLTVVGALIGPVSSFLGFMWKFSGMELLFTAIGAALGAVAGWIRWLWENLPRLIERLKNMPILGGLISGAGNFFNMVGGGRASGGDVVPGRVYTVGEHGPETLVMGRNGGHVYPDGGAGARRAGGGGTQIIVMPVAYGTWSAATQRAADKDLRERIRKLDKEYA